MFDVTVETWRPPRRRTERESDTGCMCGGQTQMGEVRVVGIRVEQPQNQPVLLLREANGDRYLPIWIGQSGCRYRWSSKASSRHVR